MSEYLKTLIDRLEPADVLVHPVGWSIEYRTRWRATFVDQYFDWSRVQRASDWEAFGRDSTVLRGRRARQALDTQGPNATSYFVSRHLDHSEIWEVTGRLPSSSDLDLRAELFLVSSDWQWTFVSPGEGDLVDVFFAHAIAPVSGG
jgi:hypothetical protein